MSCPVCFGGDDTVMRESLNAGIGVLVGVTGIVLAAFARFIVLLARRSREAHLVEEVGLTADEVRLKAEGVRLKAEGVRLKADTTVRA